MNLYRYAMFIAHACRGSFVGNILFLIVSTDVVGLKQAAFFLYHVRQASRSLSSFRSTVKPTHARQYTKSLQKDWAYRIRSAWVAVRG